MQKQNRVYTCVELKGSKIYHRYIENGIRKKEKIEYQPRIGIEVGEPTGWKTINGKHVFLDRCESVSEWKERKRELSYLEQKIYNNIHPTYQFVAEKYSGELESQLEAMRIFIIDIEVDSSDGFPMPHEAEQKILSITIHNYNSNKLFVFAYKEVFKPKEDNVFYKKCDNEIDMLNQFLSFWERDYPDIITGWNINAFDILYIVNRITKLIGEKNAKRLSPIGYIKTRESTDYKGKKTNQYALPGIQTLDYLLMYKKYTQKSRESYTLDNILKAEFKDKSRQKLDYKVQGYKNLQDLYNRNFSLFIEYNMQDVRGIYDMDKKLKYLNLIILIAYLAKVNVEDCFGTVRIWKHLLYNELLKKNIAFPSESDNIFRPYPGGFVKNILPSTYGWTVVWDIESSYPGQIRMFNISPETLIDESELHPELQAIRSKFGSIEKCVGFKNDKPYVDYLEEIEPILKKHNVCFCANGTFYKKDHYGFIPESIERIFLERKAAKRKKSELGDEIDKITKSDSFKEFVNVSDLRKLHASVKAKDYSLKILINALYGALANQYFTFFDVRLAEAVTSMGQVCIRGCADYVERKLGVPVIYEDTDSIFLSFDELISKQKGVNPNVTSEVREFLIGYNKNVIQPVIDEFYAKLTKYCNAYKNDFKMAFEIISDNSIFTAKKHYIMKLVWDDGKNIDEYEAKVRGIEVVRTSTPQYIRDELTHVLKMILERVEKQEVFDYITILKQKFKSQNFVTIAFPRSVNFGEYTLNSKALPIHVKASLVYNKFVTDNDLTKKYRLINDKEKIKFCYLQEPNMLNSHVVACVDDEYPDELAKIVNNDYEKQFEKTFLAPLKAILKAVRWQYDEKTVSLEDFFS